MTEAEWLACDDPAGMWEILWFPTVPDHIPSRVFRPTLEATGEQDRLLRLCACAFCRHDPTLSDVPAVQRSLELSEAEADNGRDEDAVTLAESFLAPPIRNPGASVPEPEWRHYITALGLLEPTDDIWYGQVLGELSWVANTSAGRRLQADLLRDIFGNPFRPFTFDPAWLTRNKGVVVNVAESIYRDRTFRRMPDLATALEQAGCDNLAILAHCREAGIHVRGCWLLDTLLGKIQA